MVSRSIPSTSETRALTRRFLACMPRQLAIVPAYNESESVARVVAEIREHAPDFDTGVIDDGSTDDTSDRARAAGAAVIRHSYNLRIGGAVQTGNIYAAEHGYDIAVQVD